MEARTMKVQGQRTVYRVVGEGQPLVFLHAWSLGGHSYRHCLEGLATNGWQVFAPALPGFGGTSSLLPHADSGLSAYAEWVAAFVGQEIGKRPVALLGHSLGGGIAIQTAHDHPDLVDRLVLINSVGGASWTRKGEIVRGVAERPMWDWALHLASDLLPPRQLTRVIPVVAQDVVHNLLCNPLAIWRAARLAARADLSPEMTELNARALPVVIVWGHGDQFLPRLALQSLQQVADARCHTVDGKHL